MKKQPSLSRSALLLFLPCLLTLPACQKDVSSPLTVIQGRITEYGTDLPIQGVRIYLLCYDSSFFGGSSSNLADTIVTDGNGEFYREYPQADVCGGSYLIIYKEGYFKRDGIGVTTGVNNVNFALDPEAWLKLVTIPDLEMWTSLGFGGSVRPHSVYAGAGTEEQIFSYPGARSLFLHWGPFDHPEIIYSDSIYLSPHDTTTHTIHY